MACLSGYIERVGQLSGTIATIGQLSGEIDRVGQLSGYVARVGRFSGSLLRIGALSGNCSVVCDVNIGHYLMIDQDVVWLMPDNDYTAGVDIYANVEWRIND